MSHDGGARWTPASRAATCATEESKGTVQVKKRRPRCAVCGLHLPLCVCRETRPLSVPSRQLIVVQHHRESVKPTSTGPLACHLWSGSRLLIFGRRNQSLPVEPFTQPQTDYFVLFPARGAQVLSPDLLTLPAGRRQAFVVLDASWSQASRMVRRVPHVRDWPFYSLPDGPPSSWSIRRAPRPHQVCTLEAVIRLVELLAGHAAAQPLQQAFELVVKRRRMMRGDNGPPVARCSKLEDVR